MGRRNPAEHGGFVARLAPYTRFRLVLLLTGVAPLFIVPYLLRVWPLPSTGWWSTSFIYVTGVLHVGMTIFFYIDPAMKQFRRERPHLFVTWPIGIGVVTAFALAVLPHAGVVYVGVAFAAWLGWHYTGQQVGVVAMALKGEVATARLRPQDRQFVRATAVVTIAGLVRTVDLSDTPLRRLDLLVVCRAGVVVLALGLVWLLWSAAHSEVAGGGTWGTRAASLTWATAFVVPFAVVHDPIAAAAAVATVHGFHYVFLVAYLSRSRRPHAWMGTVAVGGLTAAAYVALLQWAPVNGVFSHVVPCITLTMVAAHRVVDMRVWRLREPERLDYMRRSFQFL